MASEAGKAIIFTLVRHRRSSKVSLEIRENRADAVEGNPRREAANILGFLLPVQIESYVKQKL